MTAPARIHIWRESLQPATRWRFPGVPGWVRWKPRSLVLTDCCDKRRWAKHVRIQAYYDGIRRWCAKGHGCKP
jgi:hypothetical protein